MRREGGEEGIGEYLTVTVKGGRTKVMRAGGGRGSKTNLTAG